MAQKSQSTRVNYMYNPIDDIVDDVTELYSLATPSYTSDIMSVTQNSTAAPVIGLYSFFNSGTFGNLTATRRFAGDYTITRADENAFYDPNTQGAFILTNIVQAYNKTIQVSFEDEYTLAIYQLDSNDSGIDNFAAQHIEIRIYTL